LFFGVGIGVGMCHHIQYIYLPYTD
jgi:hypothetical protein